MTPAKIILLLIVAPICSYGQRLYTQQKSTANRFDYNLPADVFNKSIIPTYNDSTCYFFKYIAGGCKLNFLMWDSLRLQTIPVIIISSPNIVTNTTDKRPPFIEIHGNVTYDFFYRSSIDTPYADQDVVQHTVRTNIYATIKKTFPVVIQLNARQSNSYLFKNYVDANIQFDGNSYQSIMKDRLKNKITESLNNQSYDKVLQSALQEKYAYKQQLEAWLQNGKQLQQLIESKQTIASAMPGVNIDNMLTSENAKALLKDSLQQLIDANEDAAKYKGYVDKAAQYKSVAGELSKYNKESLTNTVKEALPGNIDKAKKFIEEYVKKNEQYKKYSEDIDTLEKKYKAIKLETQEKIDSIKQIVENTDDPAILQEQMKKYKLDSSRTYKWVKHLMAIKKFAIGRSMVDYSELTAKNISVTGINAEYFNKFYFAVAAGTVDYRYRDFIVRGIQKVPQYLLLTRVGIGDVNESGLVATVYQGKKQASWFNSNNQPVVSNVLGFSIEGRYRIDKNNFVIAEVAKSSYPAFIPVQNNTGTSKMFGFADRSNEAYSIHLISNIPSTQTRLSGQYKKLGINFQSFNIFNYNANYSVWQLRGDQYFFKRALFVAASVKNNEYNSPYTIYNYKSNTVFTTIQATLRLKKWPVLSAAYMPSTQLYKTDNDIIETRFSTLMASASYMYRVGNPYMHTSVMYNKFFNDRNQHQFMYYNASNWLINHSIMNGRLTLNTAIGLSYNADYRLQTIDQGVSYSLTKWLRAGGGLKWNRLNRITNAIGYYGNTQLKLKKLGEIDLSFDHGFLPGLNGVLIPNDMGRVIYIKTF